MKFVETGFKPVSTNTNIITGHVFMGVAITDNQTKFRNKYRIASTRFKNYDYSLDGAYFITICNRDRKHFLGKL